MNKNKHKAARRTRRRIGIRKRVIGTAERPRLSVYRSLNHMYAQVIDDLTGTTIAAASTRDKGISIDGTTTVAEMRATSRSETFVLWKLPSRSSKHISSLSV